MTLKDEKDKIAHPWLALLPLMLGAFVGMLSETSLNIALPQLMKAFEVSTGTMQWMVTGYMLVIGIVLPLSSLLTKWFSTKKLVIFGLSAFLVGAIISALAPVFSVLLIGRMIQGIGTGIILPLMFTVAMRIFPPYKLGTVMGACAMVIMLAPAIGPTLTGIILGALSWNWIFWCFVPVLVVALIFAITSIKSTNELTKPVVDVPSIIESVVGFAAIVSGVSLIADMGFSPLVIILLIVGIVVVGLYVRRQITLENPILNLKIFSVEAFRVGALIVMVDFGIILSAMYLLPQYIQSGRLLAVALTGIIMLPGGIINAITSAFAGRIYDSIGARKPAMIGFVLAFIGVLMFIFVSTKTPVWYIILAHVILMIGCSLAMSPSQTYALNAIQGRASADGSTIMNTLQQIVGAISTAIATILLSLGQNMAHAANSADRFTKGTHFGFHFTLVLVIVGFLLSLAIKKDDNE
ncbi:DHA2 family efflux MFS transporter permease subunit [Lactobacillus corticis]|uniref:Major facilitator superfamily transporter n=1 Tax=Lactobacillus corticis TaxID=2201249 RepID=A0A916QHW4_9LACO|nr:DHA2 family efflux MFS transporter permease subunit [Lactobacillus corticis]GFZ27634.1 major facilitator superfamily transporter [Lactobacillus corticis]